MSKELEHLIELASRHTITSDEHEAQIRSFAYGNTHFENEAITMADIDEAMTTLHAESESSIRS